MDVSIEYWPERWVVLDALPQAAGGKLAKGVLREDCRRRAGHDDMMASESGSGGGP